MGDGYPHPLPEDEVLAEAARALEDGRLAGDLLDHNWRLCYVSSELRNLIGDLPDEELAYGSNSLVRNIDAPRVWRISRDVALRWWEADAPYMRNDLPDDEEWLRGELGRLAGLLAEVPAASSPVAWAQAFTTTFADQADSSMNRLNVRLRREDGSFAGILCLYVGGGLRASVQAMLARGSSEMFERMAALTEPARRPAAVLFADLESSSLLSRRLASKAYFDLIRKLTTAIDAALIEEGGIVGKHAGDGVTAFFLAEQCGGEAEAAMAAIRAARRVRDAVAGVEAPAGSLAVNVGLHWGATLVIGQVVTEGRLEVTALGDEVNETARVQEVARGGRLLASKDLIERAGQEATGGGFDPETASYEILGELPEAGEKARRDAGGLAITEL